MPIAFNTAGPATVAQEVSALETGTFTVSGTDRLMLSFVSSTGFASGPGASTCLFGGSGGTSMVQIGSETTSSASYLRAYRHIAPSTSLSTIYATVTTEQTRLSIASLSYTGVDQTTPVVLASITTASGNFNTTSTTATAVVTTTAGDVVVGCFTLIDYSFDGAGVSFSEISGTERMFQDGGTENVVGVQILEATASGTSTTFSTTMTVAQANFAAWQFVGFILNPAGGGGGGGPTIYRPTSDVQTAGWVPSTGTDLFALIDETTFSDSDYITSPTLGTGSPAIFGLSGTLAAGTYLIRLRGNYTITDGQARISLLNSSNVSQGTSGWTTLNSSATTHSIVVTSTGSATRIQIEVQGSGGGGGGGGGGGTGLVPDYPVFLRTSGSLVGAATILFLKPSFLANGAAISGDAVTHTYLYRFTTEDAARLGSAGSPVQTVDCGTASTGTFSSVAAGTYWVSAECENSSGISYPSQPIQIVVT
jgi:hypothetical protein